MVDQPTLSGPRLVGTAGVAPCANASKRAPAATAAVIAAVPATNVRRVQRAEVITLLLRVRIASVGAAAAPAANDCRVAGADYMRRFAGRRAWAATFRRACAASRNCRRRPTTASGETSPAV